MDKKQLLSLLRGCKTAIDLGFTYDGDVYGIQHNSVTDTLLELEQAIALLENGGAS